MGGQSASLYQLSILLDHGACQRSRIYYREGSCRLLGGQDILQRRFLSPFGRVVFPFTGVPKRRSETQPMVTDMVLLSQADVSMAARQSSFTQSMPRLLAIARKGKEKRPRCSYPQMTRSIHVGITDPCEEFLGARPISRF